MKSFITTIEALNGKPVSELHALFAKAADAAASEQTPAQERAAARQTMENIRRSLQSRKAPGPRP